MAQDLPYDNASLACETLNTEEEKNGKERIYLGVHNLHECYQVMEVDEKTYEAKTIPMGLLERYNPEKQVFYITGNIPLSHWKRLMNAVASYQGKKKFHFLLAPNASIENTRTNTQKSTVPENKGVVATTYTSNDPGYLTGILSQQMESSSKKPLIIDVNAQTTFHQLIGEIKQVPDGIDVKKGYLLQALERGEDIILNGEISFALYQQLLPLLSQKPYIDFNGKQIDFPKQKLVLVMPDNIKMTLLSNVEHRFKFEDYEKKFKSKENFEKIILFYKRMQKLPHRGPGRPERPYMSYQRIQAMMNALDVSNPLHPHNPVKSIINSDYPADSDDYAYLNVMGKVIFRENDNTPHRAAKLDKLKKRFSINTPDDVKKHAWHLLNCFNGAAIKEILGDQLKEIKEGVFPSLFEHAVAQLVAHVLEGSPVLEEEKSADAETAEVQFAAPKPEEKSTHTRHEKQMKELDFYLQSKNPPIIILQGPAGVGKSHAVRTLLAEKIPGKKKCYEGKKDIIAWLESDGTIPFLADEMNMTDDWDFLAGMGRPDKTVVYQGNPYKLGKHRVIGTCNPVGPHYPGRHLLRVAQDLSATIVFKELSDDFYRDVVLKSKLAEKFPDDHGWIIDVLIDAYHLAEQYNPHITRSIRDIENVAERFLYLANKNKPADEVALKNEVLKACLGEFGTAIHGFDKRQEFANHLRSHEKLKLPAVIENNHAECKLIPLTAEIALPTPKQYFIDAVEQDLGMRWQAMLKKALAEHKAKKEGHFVPGSITLPYYKQSIVVEGEAGGGKSVCLRAIVQKHLNELGKRKQELEALQANQGPSWSEEMQVELDLLTKEYNKKVIEVSGGSAKPKILASAFHGEHLLVNDESNINPEADQLISQFLCGIDENLNPASSAFMHLGSQNSTAYGGRPTLSRSKQNRDHVIYLDDFTEAEEEAFARENVEDPDAYTRAYHDICKQYPHANMRTFHEVAKIIKLSRSTEHLHSLSLLAPDSPAQVTPAARQQHQLLSPRVVVLQ